MQKGILFAAICLLILSSCSVLNKSKKNKQDIKECKEVSFTEETVFVEETTSSKVLLPPPPPASKPHISALSQENAKRYGFLINNERTDYGVFIKKAVEFKGDMYLIIDGRRYFNQLWRFDGDTTFKKLIDHTESEAMEAQAKSELKFDIGDEYGNRVRGVSSFAIAKDKLYLSYSNGRISNRLYEYDQKQGPIVVDGVTKVYSITTWNNQWLIYTATNDNDVSGLYTVDSNKKPKLILECNTGYPNFRQDGTPYGYSHCMPVIDSIACITSGGFPYIVQPDGKAMSWNFPEKMRITGWAQIEEGVFMVENINRTFLRIEKDYRVIEDPSKLPEYMHAVEIKDDFKSINNTVYFSARTVSQSDTKVLYYKNKQEFGDVTEEFNRNDIKVEDLITEFQGNLIVGKKVVIKKESSSTKWLYILKSYNPKTKEFKDITSNGKPMEINKNCSTFRYKGYLYFIGNNAENKNCIWRYDGMNEPEIIDFKNLRK
jgi:hypothetical protein